MRTIDGSQGEGGGQVLRTTLGLALVTGERVRVVNIRAGRKTPGLLRQHVTAVEAAVAVSGGEAFGCYVGSTELEFAPGRVDGGDFAFSIGTAGSTSLVFQAVLPGVLRANKQTRITIEGGTHNPMAPPFEFIADVILPALAQMGYHVEATLERFGFFPAGGGRVSYVVTPCTETKRIELTTRGNLLAAEICGIVAEIPGRVARDEVDAVVSALGHDGIQAVGTIRPTRANSPGNVLNARLRFEHAVEHITVLGRHNVSREVVAAQMVAEIRHFLAQDVPVGEYFADQLPLPMLLARGGEYVTSTPSLHTTTQIDVIRQMTGVSIAVVAMGDGRWRVVVPGL